MANINQRHHAAHPPTAVKPNVAVNQKPEAYTPPEKAAVNVNPSLPGPVGVDAVNARVPQMVKVITRRDEDDLNPDDATEDATDDPDTDERQVKPNAFGLTRPLDKVQAEPTPRKS